jgi:peroxiredoxin
MSMLKEDPLAIAKRQPTHESAALSDAVETAIAELARSQQASRAVHAGQSAPRFRLPDQSGVEHTLAELSAEGPLVLSFYRGLWCPYCAKAVKGLAQASETLIAHGARLAAISPEASSSRAASLPFPTLIDHDGYVMRKFGLEWTLPSTLCRLLAASGIDVAAGNRHGSWALPIPARYVIDTSGMVLFGEVNPDFRERADPLDLLPVIDAIVRRR